MNKVLNKTVYSPVPSGSGAVNIHECLQEELENYELRTFNPKATLIPPVLSCYKNYKFETVHSSIELVNFLTSASQFCVGTVHNYYLDVGYRNYSDFIRSFYYSTLLKYQFTKGLKRADKIVSVSKTTYDLVVRDLELPVNIKSKFEIILNGVDCTKFKVDQKKEETETFKILFAGNPISRKGWPIVVKLADALPSNCVILCTTGMRDIKGLARHPRIEYLKRVPHSDMPKIYHKADLLLLPSYREGLSLVMLEAMASGLPIVGFNVSSIPEAVVNKKGGFLTEVGNLEELVQAVIKLSNNKEQCRQFGLFNRERCEILFNQNRMVREYNELFSK